ncbi:EthD family reductase [Pseudomonas viridiflava]|uniref:EthD family reductase n=1 Tax=Pseudomonas viridiflava TaxID=33069 RepID=UPI002EAE496F|nr:EthD family reductase [Pseudomonas viridiflava]
MIDVSILYPNEAGATFDFDYYREQHMTMIHHKMAGACSHFTIEKGLQGPVPGSEPTYIAIGHLFVSVRPTHLTQFSGLPSFIR